MKRSVVVACCTLLALAACGRGADDSPPADVPADTTAAAPPMTWAPAVVSAEAFRGLRWIEGTWVGTGGEQPFYEGYTFVNDTTIRTRSYIDSTFSFAADSGFVILSDGVLTLTGGDAVWVASEIDSTRVHFEPRLNALNNFTWTRQSPTTWRAVLRSSTGTETVFEMRRVGGR